LTVRTSIPSRRHVSSNGAVGRSVRSGALSRTWVAPNARTAVTLMRTLSSWKSALMQLAAINWTTPRQLSARANRGEPQAQVRLQELRLDRQEVDPRDRRVELG